MPLIPTVGRAGGELADRPFERVTVETIRQPSSQLERFVTAVHAMRVGGAPAAREQCSFRTDVPEDASSQRINASQVTQVADLPRPDLLARSEKLLKNGQLGLIGGKVAAFPALSIPCTPWW